MTTLPFHEVFAQQQAYFRAGRTLHVNERRQALITLQAAIRRMEQPIMQALQQDLGKSQGEAYMTEVGVVLDEVRMAIKHVRRWAKPRKVRTALTHVGSRGMIVPEPYGCTLIISPWNYPFQLAIAPLIGAIAAGNTAILKPSELTPHTSACLAKLIRDTFDPQHVTVIEGGAETSQQLTALPFDHIFFTGSVAIGKIIMQAAAKRLTPVTLELGGKSPCVVHADADIRLAAKRIAFGKWTNAGQTCVAPDYIYVHRSRYDELIHELERAVQQFFGEDPLNSGEYASIVSKRHFERLATFMDNGAIAFGGSSDATTRRMSPTVLTDVTWEMPVMQEEIFGPILPVLTYDSFEEVERAIIERPKPLALYLFTNDRQLEQHVISRISFGGGCINDTLMHFATPYLPFGGVGESGIGRYHGHFSFQAFSHEKSVLRQTTWFDFSFRYPGSKHRFQLMRKLFK
ncbi:aldehyde dehydrogenase [Paenibacillus sp. 481]|uniref:aldehyde dehydrogenase n=1 Tax=Paenibacillus sp. 481 TaxID=2835869 RepID=UPI001E3FA95C|nr:aldehyde dehydrogenase [Paenibacillus sp. 481]UHA74570.1 aldehyde dehydrogenase [Paenibacillus sp. 481]